MSKGKELTEGTRIRDKLDGREGVIRDVLSTQYFVTFDDDASADLPDWGFYFKSNDGMFEVVA